MYHQQLNVEIFFVPSHFLRQDEKISRDFELLQGDADRRGMDIFAQGTRR